MKLFRLLTIGILIFTTFLFAEENKIIELPKPVIGSEVNVEQAIANRRSVRSYKDEPITLQQLGQLLWAAQGLTGPQGYKRAAPSAGATYPLVVYVVIANVEDLAPGIYKYLPKNHSLELHIALADPAKKLEEIETVAFKQKYISQAAINIIIAAIYENTTKIYGDRGYRYVFMEVGHVGQNIHLQCETLGLGTVMIGAFNDKELASVLELTNEEPLYIIPVGIKKF